MEATATPSKNWHEADELMLVDRVYVKKNDLLGKFKGSGRGKESKKMAWNELTAYVNA
jgi:hypothetical protein